MSLPWFIAGVTVLGASAAAVIVRSILRPNPVRAFKDYGTPQAHGLDAHRVTLPGDVYGWFASNADADVAVLLVHGRSRASGWMYPIAQRLASRASVMAIDLPGHGKSPGKYCSYGFRESKAVRDALTWLETEQPLPVVIIGISMGGAASLIAMNESPSSRVTGVITIGTYADIASVFQRLAKGIYLPWFLGKPLAKVAGGIGGFNLRDRRPVDAVRSLKVPYLAIQGDEDELVPTSAARLLASSAPEGLARASYYHGEHDVPEHEEMLRMIERFLDERSHALVAADAP